MSDLAVAKRYAVALFQIAKEQNLLDQIEEELRTVKEVFTNDNDLLSFLEHPKVTNDAKRTIIVNAFSSLSAFVQNTLQLMIDRHRTDAIVAMADEFIELANEAKSVADAKVYSVRPLTDAETDSCFYSICSENRKKNITYYKHYR